MDTVKILLGITDNSYDAILNIMMSHTRSYILNYCNVDDVTDGLMDVQTQMVVEKFNKLGAEGIASRNYSGISEVYNDDYSAQIYKQLNAYRKIKMM